jgi:ABC-type multidrug transport system fused ATPase/permease subunit
LKCNIYKDYNISKDFIGYVSQMTNLLDDTIIANVAFGRENPNIEIVRQSLKDAQLLKFIESLPQGLYTKIGEKGVTLSGGQIQRISIARALYRNPKIIIFDEATSSLDFETENNLIKAINSLKGRISIIMIAHKLSTLKKCDAIYEIKRSKFYKVVIDSKIKL